MNTDVVHVPFPRTDSIVLPAKAIEVAASLPDACLCPTIFRRSTRKEDGQLGIDVALDAGRNLDGLRDEID